MLIKSRAIVLSRLKYNDSSDIACLFTEAVGAVSFVVRIPKTRHAGNKSLLFQPLNLLQIEWDYREGQSLSIVRNVQCDYPYATLLYEPFKAAMVSYLSEFLYYALRDEQVNERVYNYLSSSLQWLDVAENGYSNFHIALQVRMTQFLGIFPNVADFRPERVFDMQNACYVDRLPVHGYCLTGREADFVRRLVRMSVDNMRLFRFSTSQRSRLLELMNTYYRLHVPRFPVLKSIEVLRDVFS